jgi:hypothetical protein
LLAQHPGDHIALIRCEDLASHSKLSCEHVVQYIEAGCYRGAFQFHFEVGFSPLLNLLTIRGNYLHNGLFVHLQSREQQLMALRMAANLNPEISPLKLTVNSFSGELLLEHSSFIDTALADMKFKRNLVNLTFRITFILELLIKHRYLLLYFSGFREVVRREDLPPLRGLQAGEERMALVEGSLREVCLESYNGEERVDFAVRRELMKHNSLHFQEDF